ncbi:MAG: hypothetical protein ABRQ38_31165 [Candidatus Eremiobacterota bacterium]
MIQKQIPEEIEYLSNIKNNRKKILTEAAEALLNDYTDNKELTIFTELNSEDFYN